MCIGRALESPRHDAMMRWFPGIPCTQHTVAVDPAPLHRRRRRRRYDAMSAKCTMRVHKTTGAVSGYIRLR